MPRRGALGRRHGAQDPSPFLSCLRPRRRKIGSVAADAATGASSSRRCSSAASASGKRALTWPDVNPATGTLRVIDGTDRKLTLHGLRHTHVSVALATGTEAGYVADQVGHTDAEFTYKRCRKAVKRHAGELERWRAPFRGEPMSPPEAAPAAHAAA